MHFPKYIAKDVKNANMFMSEKNKEKDDGHSPNPFIYWDKAHRSKCEGKLVTRKTHDMNAALIKQEWKFLSNLKIFGSKWLNRNILKRKVLTLKNSSSSIVWKHIVEHMNLVNKGICLV